MRALAFSLLLAGPVAAQEFPALYAVTGVAADDVLNVRALPDPDSPVIDTLPPDARNVEVLVPGPRGRWAKVNSGEGIGWVSLAYLERQPGQEPGAVPVIGRCFGTEPFWALRQSGTGYTFSAPDRADLPLTASWSAPAAGRGDRHAIGYDGATLVVTHAYCTDGMSDRQFGLTADLILSGDQQPAYYTGCCTLAP